MRKEDNVSKVFIDSPLFLGRGNNSSSQNPLLTDLKNHSFLILSFIDSFIQ